MYSLVTKQNPMIITKLEKIDQKKTKVYADDEYVFLLYPPDIRKYEIQEEKEIPESVYTDIIENTIYRRAKQKALAILKYMDRTESELAEKLRKEYYTEPIILRTIEYVRSYNYIDDERYARNYVRTRKSLKSRKQLQIELKNKGIEKELINNTLDICMESDEEALLRAYKKKVKNPDELTTLQKQKVFASLFRKGFRYEDIKKYLDN